MRVLVPLLLVLVGATAVSAEERRPAERAFVEVSADPVAPYVGQPFVLRLRLGFDKRWFEAHAVPLFRMPMDVPVQVDAPWLRALSATRDPLLPAQLDAGDAPGLSFVLNDQVVRATVLRDVVRDGLTFAVLEVSRSFEATRPGVLEVEEPSLRFAHATEFEDDFVGGRVAINRVDETLRGQAISLQVRALPEAGRPPDFDGAVGRFRLQARLDESRLEAQGILRLLVEIRGDGNLWTFPRPRLRDLEGFHLYGATESRQGDHRAITYELAPTSPHVKLVPAVTLLFFDPTRPGAYRRAQTEPLPLTVSVPAHTGGEADPPAGTASSETASTGPSLWHRFRVCLGMLLAALCLGLYVRRRQARLSTRPALSVEYAADDQARAEQIQSADAVLRAALGGPAAADGLAAYLAVQLAVPTAVIVAPDLAARLAAAGVSPDLAGRTAEVLARHVAARYGAPAPGEAHLLDEALVDALQGAFELSAG